MDPQAQELIEKVKGANNVLVTVSANPSVDQLAAAIGLTIFLNKLNKHGTAVFSGAVPSTIEFLKPEETLEKNTDSLRDFIIALDKAKADKLRYKVEENVVKIFITPYKTSITQEDLDFSQGDFNVDVVICIGLHEQQDLDQAITAHGRILHDAVVTNLSIQQPAEFASLNWVNTSASSLSEIVVALADALGRDQIDGQIATALLTGIVAETDRFSNEKTTPETMRLSAELMAVGANQQLVASALQAPAVEAFTEVPNQGEALPPEAPVNQDGTLEIDHVAELTEDDDELGPLDEQAPPPPPTDGPDDADPASDEPSPDASETPSTDAPDAPAPETSEPEHTEDGPQPASRMILQPPTTGGTLTANIVPEGYDATVDPLTMLAGNDDAASTSNDSVTDDQAAPAAPEAAPVEPEQPEQPEILQPEGLILPDVAPTEEADESAPEQPTEEPASIVPEISSNVEAVEVPATDNAPSDLITPTPTPEATPPVTPAPTDQPAFSIDANGQIQGPDTLTDLEKAVASPHVQDDSTAVSPSDTPVSAPVEANAPAESASSAEIVDDARNAVLDAINDLPSETLPPQPQASSGSTGYLNVHDLEGAENDAPAEVSAAITPAAPSAEPPVLLDESPTSAADQPILPPSLSLPPADTTPLTTPKADPTAAPPVPPPLDPSAISQIIGHDGPSLNQPA